MKSRPLLVMKSCARVDPVSGFESFPIRIRATPSVVVCGGRPAWHAHYEETALGFLQFVDFDENVRFRTVIDIVTETGCGEIADALDGVRPGPLAVLHTKYDETAPCVGERDHGLPKGADLGFALLAPRVPRLEFERLGLESVSRFSVEAIQESAELAELQHD